MAIFKRKSKHGETAEYHYKFMQRGKSFYGVCEGCTTERTALAYEKKIREIAKTASEQKSVKALIDNFRDQLTGGHRIALTDAYDAFLKQPTRRPPGPQQIRRNRTYFNDFVLFMAQNYPQETFINDIQRKHAGEYLSQLRKHGAFCKDVSFVTTSGQQVTYKTHADKLSARTINARHKAIKAVFARLSSETGIVENPFSFETLEGETVSRDIFSDDEIRKIGEAMTMPYTRPIFTIGLFTGLTLGDICLLRWSEIEGSVITHKKRRKTGVDLEIPILQPLAAFLIEQRQHTGNSEYVSPELAEMYQNNPSGVFYRIKKFLKDLNIQTDKSCETRSRSTTLKATHSLRHTFAYLAGVYNIPLPIVQGILGHMSQEMTKHYQAHATREAKQRYLSMMPDFFQSPKQPRLQSSSVERDELNELLDKLSPEAIREIFIYIKKHYGAP